MSSSERPGRRPLLPTRLLAALLLFLLLGPALAAPGPVARVVLVSLDGMRPDFYLDPALEAPALRRLKDEGAWAERMAPLFPTVTYVNHTSLVTGARPARHGISSNRVFDPVLGPLPAWNWEADRVQVPTLFDRARTRGLRTAAFGWPVTVGAAIDDLIPEIMAVPGANTGTTEELIRQHSTPGLVEAVEARPDQPPFPRTLPEWDAWVPEAVALALENPEVRLVAVHLLAMDEVQHRHGPDSEATRRALAEIDRQVGRIAAQVNPADTTLILAGDHGFQAYDRAIHPNRLFADQGWLEVDQGRIRSWRVAAQVDGGAAAIYCKEAGLAEAVTTLLRREAGNRWEVLDRARLDELGTMPGALCALAARPGFSFRGAADRPLEDPLPETAGQHGHLPDLVPTGLVLWGRGVEAGPLGAVSVLDVAPTVARLLDLSEVGMEGHPLVGGIAVGARTKAPTARPAPVATP